MPEPEPEPEPESPIETRHVNKTDHRSVKPVHKKKSSLQRKIQGITLNNRILIGVIASLGVILIVLGLSLASYLKTDSFNPVALFNKDETNDVVERDEEAPKITSPKAEDTVKIADAIEVEGTEEKSENDEESAVDVDLFAEFLAGNAKAVVADDFLCSIEWTNEMKPGREYTFQELKDYVLNDEKMSYESFENPEAWYTTINVHGGTMNALRLFYMIKDNEYDEGLYETYVFHDNNGRLEMKFAIDESNFGTGPSNRGGSVDASGVSNYYAHDGAGEGQYSRIYAPDTNFSYKMICDEESHIAFDPAFYDTNNTPMESLNRTMEEAASQNESAHYVRYYREKINNDVYFYYLNDGEEGLTQSTVDFIDAIAAANGFGFDGKATADAAREAYEKELGVYEICQKYTEPQWTDIK